MKIWKKIAKGLAWNEWGSSATEAALLIALVAAIAGFGMVLLGESMSNFFTAAATAFDPHASVSFDGS